MTPPGKRHPGKPSSGPGRRLPLLDEDGELEDVTGVTTNLSGLKDLEGRLRHAHMMEAVGRLASGVVQDFDNVLTAIQGRAHFLAEELEDDTPLALEVAESLVEVAPGARLSGQMLALARKPPRGAGRPGEPSENGQVRVLRQVAEDMRSMLRRLVPVRMEFDVDLGYPQLAATRSPNRATRGIVRRLIRILGSPFRESGPS